MATKEELQQQYREARQELADLLNIKPNAQGRYLVDGKLLTKAGFDKVVNNLRSEIDDIQLKISPSAESVEAQQASLRDQRLAQSEQLQMTLRNIERVRKEFENGVKRVALAGEQDNLNSWINVYKAKEAEIKTAIASLGEGRNLPSLPTSPQIVPYDVAKARPATGTRPTAQPETQPSTPVTPAPATTGALFVPQDSRPVRGPGMTAAEAQGKFSELRPGTKAGDFVGGADRTLDNGGAVVQGIYIPPGTFGTSGAGTTGVMGTGGGGGAGGTGAGGGGGGTAMAPSPAATPTVPADWESAAQEQYGGYYAIIKSVPEIAGLLQMAVSEEWSDAKFDYELKQTGWYKTTSASAREWDVNKQRDPASAQQQIDARIATIREQALGLGVRLSDATISKLSEDSLRGGWTEQILQNAIGSEAIKSVSGVSQLRTGFVGQQLRQTASNYGVSLSDTTFNEWVNKIAVGQENAQSFQQYALNTAKALYPGISAQLDAGQTFQQITDPYRQTAARTLEINAETIDFTDPKWAKAVTFVTDKGEQRPMNYNEWGDYLRQTRSFGYEFTQDAQSRAFQVANDIANLFGKV